MPPKITADQKLTYHRLRYADKVVREEAAKAAGVGLTWAYHMDRKVREGEEPNLAEGWMKPTPLDKKNSGTTSRDLSRMRSMAEAFQQPPIPLTELSPMASAQLEDFHLFCKIQFGIVDTPWRRAAFRKLWALWESPEAEYVVLNAPPGVGKSQITSHDIPAFLTVRNRHLRGLLGSASQRLATPYTRKLRQSFMRQYPLEAPEDLVAAGLRHSAESTLIADFGRFVGDDKYQEWKADAFQVETVLGADTGEKEPTWQAYGRDSEQLGNRVNYAGWDDLVTKKTMSMTISEDFVEWFEDEAETRLEPGGLFVLNGQRLGEDLYRNRLDAEVIDIDENGEETRSPKYHHIVFRAHADENCKGVHRRTDPPQDFGDDGELLTGEGRGCLLDPKRLPWRRLASIRSDSPRKYEVVYQQSDYAEGDRLVSDLWINGGTDRDGQLYPGCADFERNQLQIPLELAANTLSVASVDPSSSKKWSVQWWLNEPGPDIDHLLDLYLGQLTAGELLSYNPKDRKFYGMMQDWQIRSVEMGRPIQAWVVETNAAQRYLLQHQFVHQWMSLHEVQIISHETHARNKLDPEHGFWSMRNQYRWGKVRLPYRANSAGFYMSRKLVDQGLRWTSGGRGGRGGDDALMAQWIYRVNLPKIQAPQVELMPPRAASNLVAPSWMR